MSKTLTYLGPAFNATLCGKSVDIFCYLDDSILSGLTSLDEEKQYVIDNNVNVTLEITRCLAGPGCYIEDHIKSIGFDTYNSLISYINENFSGEDEFKNLDLFLDANLDDV